MKHDNIFDYVNATTFLPTFCGIPITSMTRHKLRGKNGNGKPVDFTPEEKQKILAGVEKFYKRFAKPGTLTLQDLIDNKNLLSTSFFKLKNGVGVYYNVKPTSGALVVVFRAGMGTGKEAKRWLPPSTEIELVKPSSL